MQIANIIVKTCLLPQAVVVMTPGLTNDKDAPASRQLASDISFYVIGVGSKINVANLKLLVDGKDERVFMQVDDEKIHDLLPLVLG